MNFNEFIKNENIDKIVNTPFGSITIPKERSIYNEIRRRYKVLAINSAEAFAQSYESYQNCEDIITNAPTDFQKSIANIIDEIKNTLISQEQYEWDYDSIYEFVIKADMLRDFDKAMDDIVHQVAVINNNLEYEKAYRQQRKDSRGKWVGGTFGGTPVKAVSHQMDLAAMNLASGAVHGVVNLAGNLIFEMEATASLKSLFKNPKTRQSLIDSVYSSAFAMQYACIILSGKEYTWDEVEKDDALKAQRLLNNLTSGAIGDEKIAEICTQIVTLNPYNAEFYEYLFGKFGDDGSLTELATYFCVDELLDIKGKYALQYVKDNQGETEEDATNAKNLLIDYCNSIKLETSDNLECFIYINDLIADFDLKYRTVDGVECSTRESADFSREELPAIQEFMKSVSPLTGEPLLPYERDLLSKKEVFENTFSSEVSQKHLGIINSYLEKFEKQFCKTQLFSSVSREQASKDRALKYAKGLKFSNLAEYEREYEKFIQFLEPNLGITIDEATEAKLYLEKKKSRVEKVSSIDVSNISSNIQSGITNIGGSLKGLFGKKK